MTTRYPQSARSASFRFPRRALALAVSLGCSTLLQAQSGQTAAADDSEDSSRIEIIEVYGQADTEYKARTSADMRRVVELVDMPQTMTILTQTQILDSGKSDLKDILNSQAGITLGTGENGNAFGDRYIIRGHEARSDVFVDGVRDPGMTTRESFATEQIEITKGPSSTFAGRGSTGGAVNGITKQANLDQDFGLLNTELGTDHHHRVTLDTNTRLTDAVAVRANLLHSDEDVPDRSPASRERKGGLLSLAWEATPELDVVADLYALDAWDMPDLGSYFNQATRKPVEDIPVYAQDSDFLDSEVRTFTFKATYAIHDDLRVQNATRVGTTQNGYVTTGTRGGTRAAGDPTAPNAPTITFSSHQGWQEVDYLVNQTNFFWDIQQGSVLHQLVFGAEYTDEDVLNGVYTLANTGATNCRVTAANNPAGTPGYCGLDGQGNAVANINSLLGRTVTKNYWDTDYGIDTVSLFAMDTVEFNERWSAFFGVRNDRYDYRNNVRSGSATAPTYTLYDYSDDFWNGHVGIVRAFGNGGNVYATWSTSTNINGGESDVGGSCGYGGLCGTPAQVAESDPETMENLELGVKWHFFDEKLLATAAVFNMTKSDIHESVGNAYSNLGTLNTGENRVRGVEFSLVGNITDKLSTQVSAAFMESEVTKAFVPEQVGLALSNFADDSVYLQLRYQATPAISFGGSVTYQSEMYGGQPDTAAGFNAAINDYSIVVPSYSVVDLFLNYEHSDRLALRVNAGNVLDEEYWTAAYRSGSFMYLGARQNLRASVTYGF